MDITTQELSYSVYFYQDSTLYFSQMPNFLHLFDIIKLVMQYSLCELLEEEMGVIYGSGSALEIAVELTKRTYGSHKPDIAWQRHRWNQPPESLLRGRKAIKLIRDYKPVSARLSGGFEDIINE